LNLCKFVVISLSAFAVYRSAKRTCLQNKVNKETNKQTKMSEVAGDDNHGDGGEGNDDI
jgi:hypothetical protein